MTKLEEQKREKEDQWTGERTTSFPEQERKKEIGEQKKE